MSKKSSRPAPHIVIERSDSSSTNSDSKMSIPDLDSDNEISTAESNSDSEMSTTEPETNDRETLMKATSQSTSKDSNSDGQTSIEKLYSEILVALRSGELSAVTKIVKKSTFEQRSSLCAMVWADQKLLEKVIPWSEFMDHALQAHGTNHKLPTPKEVVRAAVVLMEYGAYRTSQNSKVGPRPRDKQSVRERRTANPTTLKRQTGN